MDDIKITENIQTNVEMSPTRQNLIKYSKNNKSGTHDNSQFEAAFNKARQFVKINNTRISLSWDKENQEPVIYVMDNETDEVVRRIPPEKLIEIADDDEKLKGFFIEKDV
ncbi:MAG: flagellar protein FlaG [Fidelibacterota bacterium]